MIRFWLGFALGALLVLSLVLFARGRDHHRGDDVGAFARGPVVTTTGMR